MANKVMFGLSNVHVAFLTEETGVYATPVAVPGAVSLALEPVGEESPFYADNIEYYTTRANQGYSGDIEMALIQDAVLAEMLGWEVDDNGVLVELADAEAKPFALLFEIEGNAADKRYVLYKTTVSRPGVSGSTKTETTEPATQALTMKAVVVDFGGIETPKGSIEYSAETAAVYNAWYDAVTEPAFASA